MKSVIDEDKVIAFLGQVVGELGAGGNAESPSRTTASVQLGRALILD